MPDPLPIPPAVWTRILAFLEGQKTGTIRLHVHLGRVTDCALEERYRPDARSMLDSRQ